MGISMRKTMVIERFNDLEHIQESTGPIEEREHLLYATGYGRFLNHKESLDVLYRFSSREGEIITRIDHLEVSEEVVPYFGEESDFAKLEQNLYRVTMHHELYTGEKFASRLSNRGVVGMMNHFKLKDILDLEDRIKGNAVSFWPSKQGRPEWIAIHWRYGSPFVGTGAEG